MTRELGAHVPPSCPYCDAPLASNDNPKHKYREFSYECGAIGAYYESYEDEHRGRATTFLSVDRRIFWGNPCSVAEDDFEKGWFLRKRQDPPKD